MASREVSLSPIRRHGRKLLLAAAAILLAMLAGWLVSRDGSLYGQQTARVTAVSQSGGVAGGATVTQQVTAVLVGGADNGERVVFTHTYPANLTDGVRLRRGDEVFVTRSGSDVKFEGYKYDGLLYPFLAIFALLLLWVGGRRGMLALVSAACNTVLFLLVVRAYIRGGSFLLPAAGAAAVSAVFTIFLVTGRSRRTAAALLSSLGAAVATLLLTAAVLWLTGSRGMHYDQMEVLTRSPREVFLAQVLVGTLGGIMDIAVTMTAAVQELLDRTPDIAPASLWHSGIAVGQDMLSTMTGTMLFAYLSGSIPLVLLELENSYAFPTVIHINLSLEIVRLLVGCLGIVGCIPLSLGIALRLLPARAARQASRQGGDGKAAKR